MNVGSWLAVLGNSAGAAGRRRRFDYGRDFHFFFLRRHDGDLSLLQFGRGLCGLHVRSGYELVAGYRYLRGTALGTFGEVYYRIVGNFQTIVRNCQQSGKYFIFARVGHLHDMAEGRCIHQLKHAGAGWQNDTRKFHRLTKSDRRFLFQSSAAAGRVTKNTAPKTMKASVFSIAVLLTRTCARCVPRHIVTFLWVPLSAYCVNSRSPGQTPRVAPRYDAQRQETP